MKILSKEKFSLVRRIVLFHILVNLFNIGLKRRQLHFPLLLIQSLAICCFVWSIWTSKKGFPNSSGLKNLPAMQEPQETWVRSRGQDDTLEEEMETYSSILAWKILWSRGAWQVTVHRVTELDKTEHSTNWQKRKASETLFRSFKVLHTKFWKLLIYRLNFNTNYK